MMPFFGWFAFGLLSLLMIFVIYIRISYEIRMNKQNIIRRKLRTEPLFKIGDVIEMSKEEPWDASFRYKIIQIGNSAYLAKALFEDGSLSPRETELRFYTTNICFKKVN